jgi:hypothetical protein
MMQFIAVLLAATSVVLAQTVPTLSSFSAAGCSCKPLATWSGVPEDAFCKATPGAIALSVTPDRTGRCQIDLFTTCELNAFHL